MDYYPYPLSLTEQAVQEVYLLFFAKQFPTYKNIYI